MWIDVKDFLLKRVAGKLLFLTGIIGVVLTLTYDTFLSQRPFEFGIWQRVALGYFIFCAFVGYELDSFTKDL